ncbi:mechanosensitive ion channel protein [Coraliomargarita sinensis]|uniref:Mechanosensitive ion channel protein n=1 Tax=Coraliomargarita sinensis TaxID=2174842 RepID=A0A317ZJ78_9BACT|nr:mechanosensitive ion channel family protein [Coraliomargarita sinensis]PXA04283.1 mechanosensitive ion channel protein [Coraliomargarita sinensis]
MAEPLPTDPTQVSPNPNAVEGSGEPALPDIEAEPLSLDRAVELLSDKMVNWSDSAIALLPNLVVAVVIFILFYAIGSVAGRAAMKAFNRTFDSNAVASLLAALVKTLIVAIGLFIALDLVGLQKAVVSLLAGAGILGLAIGFAFQDLAENLLAGLLLSIRKPCVPGDLISSNGHLGFVQQLNLRNTIIRNFSGQVIYIPNKEVFKSVLENYSKSGERRIDIAVGVSYGEDLDQVTETLKSAVSGLDFLREDTEASVYALEYGDSSINFTVRYWIDYPDGKVGYFDAIDAGVKAIKRAFDEADILIPFPIRTLDFDAKGGIKLAESLQTVMDHKAKESKGQKAGDQA